MSSPLKRPLLKGGVRMLRSALADVIVQDILGVNPNPRLIESNIHRIQNRIDSIGLFINEENPVKEIPPKTVRSISESSEDNCRCKRARMSRSDSD